MSIIYQGAEAKLHRNNSTVLKDRFAKKYRHPELDVKLRKARTRREAKVLQKLTELKIPCSQYISHDDKAMELQMQFIEGPMLKEVFDAHYETHAKLIAKQVALLHTHDIVHGDLTTSNMILNNGEVYLIDFGLSSFSTKDEDKAVDLHLLKQALESKHHLVFEGAFDIILKEYAKHYKGSASVLKRLEIVEKRGRNKQHY